MVQRINTVIDKYPIELKLLLSFLGLKNGAGSPEQIVRTSQRADWDSFLALCIHHRVYPVVYRDVRRLKLTCVPERVVDALKREHDRNTFRMLHFLREMGNVVQAFQANGIRVLVLKGPILGKELYGDISLRTSKDLDILVPPQDLGQADEIMRELGYIAVEPADLKRRHHSTYVHPSKETEIELHWRLGPEAGREPSFDALWERKAVSSLLSFPVHYLGREDLAFSLITHGFRHGWFRLRWLLDIDYLAKQPIDWKAVQRLVLDYRFGREFSQTFLLLRALLNTPVSCLPDDPAPNRQAVRFAALAADVINGRGNRKYKFARGRLGARLKIVQEILSPGTTDREMLPLPRMLHFLYFLLRPFLWTWRRMSRLHEK